MQTKFILLKIKHWKDINNKIIKFIFNMVEKTIFELIDICFIWGKLTLHAQRIIDIMEILNRDL